MQPMNRSVFPLEDRIIFPLDVPNQVVATALVDQLRGHVGQFKVGLELFAAEGPAVVRAVKARADVMLDLKLHDIPETMARATKVACDLGVGLLTVHASAGPKALEACVKAADGYYTNIVAVTVLTSLSANDLASLSIGDLEDAPRVTALRWAQLAANAGVDHFVCSPREVALLRHALPVATLITPGIRAVGAPPDDQKRTATAREAVAAGADFLVIGRPIRDAQDRLAAIEQFVGEIALGRKDRK